MVYYKKLVLSGRQRFQYMQITWQIMANLSIVITLQTVINDLYIDVHFPKRHTADLHYKFDLAVEPVLKITIIKGMWVFRDDLLQSEG